MSEGVDLEHLTPGLEVVISLCTVSVVCWQGSELESWPFVICEAPCPCMSVGLNSVTGLSMSHRHQKGWNYLIVVCRVHWTQAGVVVVNV